jgi:Na+-driven multidrug efflux pump
MTRNTNARIAGFTFLFCIGVAMTSLVLFGRAAGEGGRPHSLRASRSTRRR